MTTKKQTLLEKLAVLARAAEAGNYNDIIQLGVEDAKTVFELLAGCELVLALNDHPEARVPGYWREQPAPRGRPLLDPKAAEQLRTVVAKARGG